MLPCCKIYSSGYMHVVRIEGVSCLCL